MGIGGQHGFQDLAFEPRALEQGAGLGGGDGAEAHAIVVDYVKKPVSCGTLAEKEVSRIEVEVSDFGIVETGADLADEAGFLDAVGQGRVSQGMSVMGEVEVVANVETFLEPSTFPELEPGDGSWAEQSGLAEACGVFE